MGLGNFSMFDFLAFLYRIFSNFRANSCRSDFFSGRCSLAICWSFFWISAGARARPRHYKKGRLGTEKKAAGLQRRFSDHFEALGNLPCLPPRISLRVDRNNKICGEKCSCEGSLARRSPERKEKRSNSIRCISSDWLRSLRLELTNRSRFSVPSISTCNINHGIHSDMKGQPCGQFRILKRHIWHSVSFFLQRCLRSRLRGQSALYGQRASRFCAFDPCLTAVMLRLFFR